MSFPKAKICIKQQNW